MDILEPIPVKFGPEKDKERTEYVYAQLDSTIKALTMLHGEKLSKWRELYEGKPAQEVKSFPWPNASNIVVQVVAQCVDTLAAQIIGSIYEIMPLFNLGLIGDWEAQDHGEEMRETMEQFLNYVGLEPSELDLYRVENVWFSNTCKYGTAVVKCPWEHQVEADVIGVRDNGVPNFAETTRYQGPRPEAIPFDRFGISPNATKIETAAFKWHKISLKKYELEYRKHRKLYDAEAVNKILARPDRSGPSKADSEKQAAAGIRENTGHDLTQEWDIYECHYPYSVEVAGTYATFKIIETFHFSTKTTLRAIFNPFPKGDEQFIAARLGFSDRGFFEMGFAEMLRHYQEEVTAQHNRSADNDTLANTNVIRVDPSSKLDSNFSIYPMAILPFAKDQVEIFNLGRNSNGNIDRENQVFNLVKARTGVDQGISGSGSGITNPKRGIYSAMGTFAVMQAGNRRSNIRITDMRSAHIELGRKCLRLFAEFGVGERAKRFGKAAEWLKRGLEEYKNGKIELPVRAATASINKELEKQNDMMLVQVLNNHYQQVGQILQGLMSQQGPMQEYLMNVVIASDSLMRRMLRNFGHDDVSRLLPVPEFVKQLRDKGANNGSQQQSESGFGIMGSPQETGGGEQFLPNNIPASEQVPSMVGAAGGGAVL